MVPIQRTESINPLKQYRLVGIRLHGRGPFHRETKTGSQIAAKYLSKVRKGDFIYSRLFAWRGAFGVIGPDLDECHVSAEFPTFLGIADRLDVEFLRHWFRLPTTLSKVEAACTGSTPLTRNRFKENFFLNMEIPLPSLDEQRLIVTRIEGPMAKIEKVQYLRGQAVQETNALLKASSQAVLGTPNKKVGEVAQVTKLAGFEYTKYFTNALPGDVVVIRAGNVRNTGLNLSNAMTITKQVSDALPRSQLKPGDVVMTFIGAKIGDVTSVQCDNPRLHCGPNVAKLTPNEQISHAYLVKVLQSPMIQDQIQEITKSTAQPSLSMKTIRLLRLAVPAIAEQNRIVGYLNRLQASVDLLRGLQAETAAELSSLPYSILDRAFKGI
jgi:type I restriction enzyme S subunit